jgi:hypothetical protein
MGNTSCGWVGGNKSVAAEMVKERVGGSAQYDENPGGALGELVCERWSPRPSDPLPFTIRELAPFPSNGSRLNDIGDVAAPAAVGHRSARLEPEGHEGVTENRVTTTLGPLRFRGAKHAG